LIYALSTAAGLISTLLVSFVLIPAFETNTIMYGTAAVLGAVGSSWLVGRSRAAAALLAISCVCRQREPFRRAYESSRTRTAPTACSRWSRTPLAASVC
jgi:hypothetical protein